MVVTDQLASNLKNCLNKMYPKLTFAGCSDEDILKIIKAQNVAFLPESYTQILKLMGKSGLNRALRYDCSYDDLLYLKSDAKKLFSHVDEVTLPNDAFVFAMHHGIVAYYFRTHQNDKNPTVFGYMEDDAIVKKIYNHLSDFWLDQTEYNK